MIRVSNICKSFDGIKILKNISTTFEEGKINLIIGQSGSGKTVLMKSLLGLIKIDSGEVFYGNNLLEEMNYNAHRKLLREMGIVFQGSALFDSMTVEENVMFPLTMFTNDAPDIIQEKTNAVLDRVGLIDTNHKLPSEISGGMKRRVAIARAIILKPKYLLCDEPNSGLDPYMSSVIDKLLHELTKEYNMVTVINTHDMNSVLEIGENITFIKSGMLEWEGSNRELYNSSNQNLEDFLFCNETFKMLKTKRVR